MQLSRKKVIEALATNGMTELAISVVSANPKYKEKLSLVEILQRDIIYKC